MRAYFPAVALLLAGCASFPKPGPMRSPEPVLQRGWNYIEQEQELLDLESGQDPVSYSAPVIAGEKLVFGSDRFGVVALARKNGKQLWRRNLSGGVLAQPLVGDNKIVYAGTDTGFLYALGLEGGRELWKIDLGAPVHGTFLLAFQRLFVGTSDEALHALDPATGKVIWTYRRPAFGGTSVRGGGNPSAINGKIWMGFSDGTLLALNPETGAVETERNFRDNLKFADIDAKVIGWREGMLVATYDGRLRFLRKDGSLNWEFPAGGARAPLLSDGDVVYFPSSDGAVYALSGNTGKEIWSAPLRRGVPTGMALITRGTRKMLVLTVSEEKVLVLDALTGKLLGNSSLGRGSGSYGSIAADPESGSFYVISHSSRVHEYKLSM
jgi:outer membrane protein assembly factor BamB